MIGSAKATALRPSFWQSDSDPEELLPSTRLVQRSRPDALDLCASAVFSLTRRSRRRDDALPEVSAQSAAKSSVSERPFCAFVEWLAVERGRGRRGKLLLTAMSVVETSVADEPVEERVANVGASDLSLSGGLGSTTSIAWLKSAAGSKGGV
jgi:hypothetical protein